MKFTAITENHLYRKAYRSGSRRSSPTVTVYVLRDRMAGVLRKRNPEKKTLNRIGISASKKIGGAVQRNRAKRLIREAYRLIDKNCGVKRGFLIVIVPKTECTVSHTAEVQRDLADCFAALHLLPEEGASAESENSPRSHPSPPSSPDE